MANPHRLSAGNAIHVSRYSAALGMLAMVAEVLQALTEGLCEGMLLASLGCAVSLYYQTSRAFDFATAVLYTTGGYAFVLSRTVLEAPPLVAACVAVATTFGSALLLVTLPQRLYHHRRLSPLGIMVASLGVYTAAVATLGLVAGNSRLVPPIVLEAAVLRFGAFVFLPSHIWKIIVPSLLLLGYWLLLDRTHFGRSIRAIHSSRELAGAMGIRLGRVEFGVLLLLVIAQAVASILWSGDLGVSPNAGMRPFLYGLVAMLLGGGVSLRGPIIAGMLIGLSLNTALLVVPSQFKEVLLFVPVIVALLVRPEGVIAVARRSDALR